MNKQSKTSDVRTHCGGRFFMKNNVTCHRPLRSIAVGCSNRAVITVLLHTPQQRLPMLFKTAHSMMDLTPI